MTVNVLSLVELADELLAMRLSIRQLHRVAGDAVVRLSHDVGDNAGDTSAEAGRWGHAASVIAGVAAEHHGRIEGVLPTIWHLDLDDRSARLNDDGERLDAALAALPTDALPAALVWLASELTTACERLVTTSNPVADAPVMRVVRHIQLDLSEWLTGCPDVPNEASAVVESLGQHG